MGLARDFVTGLPKACGVPDGLHEIFAEHNGKLFDHEKANHDGPMNRERFKGHEDRLMPGFSWSPYASNHDAVEYALDLLVYAAKCRDVNEKGLVIEGLEKDRAFLAEDEREYPEISALMTVEQASTMSNWA